MNNSLGITTVDLCREDMIECNPQKYLMLIILHRRLVKFKSQISDNIIKVPSFVLITIDYLRQTHKLLSPLDYTPNAV